MATIKLGSVKATDLVVTTSVNLAADVTGTLPVGNGGNGTATFTDGQILVGQTTGNTLSKKTLSGDATMNKDGVVKVVRSAGIVPFGSDETVTTGDGKIGFAVPAILNGFNLTAAIASVGTPGSTSGTTDIQIRRVRSGTPADMLSTKITLSTSEYFAADGVINTSNDDVNTGDLIYVDVDAVNGTPPSGLSITLTFTAP